MPGTMLIIEPGGSTRLSALERPPSLTQLQTAVGGYIEQVPGFGDIDHNGASHRCIAFCNEDGKRLRLPVNSVATGYWLAAMGLPYPPTRFDVLVGNVVVLYGDDEFAKAMTDDG
jgi:hypothetical protein